jgi:hypothetical protein
MVTPVANPTATITASGSTAICEGGSVTLNANTGTGLTYQWKNNGSNILGANTFSYIANAAGTYTVVVTNGSGCSTTSTGTIVSVSQLSAPTFSQVGPYCSGVSIAALPTTSTNGFTGTWSPAINNTAITTYTFAPNAGQCASTATMTITVNPAPSITAMTSTICSGTSFTATPVDGINGTVPVGTTFTWSAPIISPASSISGGSAQATAQTSISQTLTNTTTSNATATYTVTATSGSCSSTFTVTITVLPPLVAGTVVGISSNSGGPSHLVIYQVYGGGGNSGATYKNDFVTLHNPTGSSVNLSGWSLQYASSFGTSWTKLNLNGTIQAGGYFLVQLASSGGIGSDGPTPDITGLTINMSRTSGKIALVNSTATLSGSCPTTNVIDFVGFGTVNCSEGSSAAPSHSATTWDTRKLNGCQDTDVNSADFAAGTATINNSASPTNFCTTTSLTETICSNVAASSITATAAAGSTGSFTYQWYSQAGNVTCPTGTSTSGWNLIPGATSLTYSPGTVASTTTYALFITPTGAGGCTGTWATDCRKVIVNPAITPTFNQVAPICSGAILSALSTTSNNGVTGTWSPTINNTATTAYTFTPTAGQCATTATMTITINPATVPTFSQVGPYLSGASIPALPTTSTNGISGTWSPAISNTATTTYTFTPSVGQCGTTTTMTITINEPLQYTLTANDSTVCTGTTVTLSVNIGPFYPAGTVHCNGTPTAVVDVTNPVTGKTWMDRNLGATRAATSSTDAQAYGDLYQWGRRSDGHQCRNSATSTTISSTDQPLNSNFVLDNSYPIDWRNPQNNNLWQGINGINNPCPNSYRIPTESELNNERLSWSLNNSNGAFNSPLKLPMTGIRSPYDGSLLNVGGYGFYWSSTVSGEDILDLRFDSTGEAFMGYGYRAMGEPVRCIKN